MADRHMDHVFERDLARLKEMLQRMGGLAEDQISRAIRALIERLPETAREVIERDREVNELDLEIDELCLSLLALHQPAASDLRFVTTALKTTTDIERVGDQAVNIAQRSLVLLEEPPVKPYIDIPRLSEMARQQVRKSLDAFSTSDPELAYQVIREDEATDDLAQQIFRELLSYMSEDPKTISRATQILFISRHLERIADHATNIAEMTVFMVKGQFVRHLDKLPKSSEEKVH